MVFGGGGVTHVARRCHKTQLRCGRPGVSSMLVTVETNLVSVYESMYIIKALNQERLKRSTFQRFPLLPPPLTHRATRARSDLCSTGWCCFSSPPCCSFSSQLIFSLFVVVFVMSSPCSEWQAPLGGAVAAGRGGRVSACDPPATLAQRALCAPLRFITPPLVSALLVRRPLSLQPLPIPLADTFMYTRINTHQNAARFLLQAAIAHSFQGGKRVVNSAALSPALWQRQAAMEPQIQTGSPWSGTSCCFVSCLDENSTQMFRCFIMLLDYLQVVVSIFPLSLLIYSA